MQISATEKERLLIRSALHITEELLVKDIERLNGKLGRLTADDGETLRTLLEELTSVQNLIRKLEIAQGDVGSCVLERYDFILMKCSLFTMSERMSVAGLPYMANEAKLLAERIESRLIAERIVANVTYGSNVKTVSADSVPDLLVAIFGAVK